MTAKRFDGFMESVESHPQRHCEHVRRAVSRHRRDVLAPPAGCRFDLGEGLRVCQWIESHCTFTAGEVAGRRFVLQPWQVFLVASVFGWLRGDKRRFRHAHLWVPRKAGKSELAAAVGLFMLYADGEGNPLVCATAASEKQARVVPAAAWHMVGRFDAETSRRYGAKRNRMTQRNPPIVEVEGGAGAFRGLPRDIGGSLDGLSPSCAIIDELHAYATGDTYSAMAEGMGARRKALLMIASTAGEIDGIGKQQFDLACSVLAGDTRKDDLFALVFEAPRHLDIREEATWRMANPSLGTTVDVDYMASRCEEALATGREEAFRRKQLNQWPARSDRADVWLRPDDWDACADEDIAPGRRPVWVGIAATEGRWASTMCWRQGGAWCLWSRSWSSERDVARWTQRQAAKRRLTCALDPVCHAPLIRSLERAGIDCVTVERNVRTLSLPMQAMAAHAADRRLRQKSSPTVRAQFVGMRRLPLPDGLAKPEADAPEAPISALLALAVALVGDDGGTTMRDIPDWRRI